MPIKVTDVVKEELLLFIQQKLVSLRLNLHSREVRSGSPAEIKSVQDQIGEYERLRDSITGAGP